MNHDDDDDRDDDDDDDYGDDDEVQRMPRSRGAARVRGVWVGAVVVVPTLLNKITRTTMIMFLITIVIFLTMMIMVNTDVAAPSLLKRMNIVL